MTRRGESTLRLLLDPIAKHLADPSVTEVVINRPGEAGVERRDGWTWYELPELTFEKLDAIATLCAAMSQQDVGPERPLCGSVLPDGQRVQICRPPAVSAGTISLTIRRPSTFAPTISGLAAGGLFSRTEGASRRAHPLDTELLALHRTKDWERFFPLAVQAKKTIIATGDTGSGKTTFAKALIQAIPPEERLVTIEDTAEFIGLPQRNLVSLFYSKGDQGMARVRSEELIEAALRMRPDRVLMQELRDGAAFTFIRSIAAGHPGSITTCHAGSARGAFDALRLMVKQHDAGKHLADADVRTLLHQLVDVVAHCRRDHRGFAIEEVYFDPFATTPELGALAAE
ncbi:P-type DNA transfer ATPase VirB11 [Agrobacterium rosae]|uniref:Type IV secretion system protein n=1 Tax=Agrobacterium rosae TaxID=1972867 RepID=A0A1R3U9A9_9HYPH|nr:P-type DNA transfer ATPase VirB11 [Agrobacterium rosae]SCX35818.1 Type IV secretion system protein VirB11 [Agrobacterium rosae]